MRPAHLQEIRDCAKRFIKPKTLEEAMYQSGLCHGHREVLLKAYDDLQERLDSAECIIRQASRDTFGREMTPKEFAEASSYDS